MFKFIQAIIQQIVIKYPCTPGSADFYISCPISFAAQNYKDEGRMPRKEKAQTPFVFQKLWKRV
jgi:hypothetical protein